MEHLVRMTTCWHDGLYLLLIARIWSPTELVATANSDSDSDSLCWMRKARKVVH